VAAETRINEAASPTDVHHRFTIVPGTAKLLFLDPTP
jgi:hypothetical protein